MEVRVLVQETIIHLIKLTYNEIEEGYLEGEVEELRNNVLTGFIALEFLATGLDINGSPIARG